LISNVVIARLWFKAILFEIISSFRAEVTCWARNCAFVATPAVEAFFAILASCTLESTLENTQLALGAIIKACCITISASRTNVTSCLVSRFGSKGAAVTHKARVASVIYLVNCRLAPNWTIKVCCACFAVTGIFSFRQIVVGTKWAV